MWMDTNQTLHVAFSILTFRIAQANKNTSITDDFKGTRCLESGESVYINLKLLVIKCKMARIVY